MKLTNPQRKYIKRTASLVLGVIFLLFVWAVYIPKSLQIISPEVFTVKKGATDTSIANDLKSQGIIRSTFFFKAYLFTASYSGNLRAGSYLLSPSLSISKIVRKIGTGDSIQQAVTIFEGWDITDMKGFFEQEKLFLDGSLNDALTSKAYAQEFTFLQDRPKGATLEGYIFPDTYQISLGETAEEFVRNTLSNFDKKLTPELRAEITKQKKTIFQIITMASILEKEVKSLEDKKVVSGILWKRISVGMPLQVDATVNYITRKDHAGVAIKDTKIDSPYNTYKYYGLPKGPISSPGMESIIAAIYPEKSPYWFYLSASKTGKTIFSKTLDDHNLAAYKYL